VVKFTPESSIVYSRDDTLNLLARKEKWVIFADEMINVTYKRDFYEEQQKQIIKALNMYRDSCNVFMMAVPQFKDLDGDMRQLCKIKLSMIRRSIAFVYIQPNFEDILEYTNQRTKNKHKYKNLNMKLEPIKKIGILTFKDITSRQREVYEEIKKLTVIDELTGVYNRRKFDIDLKNTLGEAARYMKSLSLLMLDIDFFKEYNDMNGHQMGDVALNRIGRIFLINKRNPDRVYRYGGEEFSMICSETDKENARIFAERLREIVENSKFDGEVMIRPSRKLTISVGVSSFPSDATNINDLIKSADSSLYRAKAMGRNRVVS